MHYVICYDIESDRLRGKTAKLLERHGCSRVQRSVFAAPFLERKQLARLQSALRHCYARQPLSAADSVLIIPLREELAADMAVFGTGAPPGIWDALPRKIIL